MIKKYLLEIEQFEEIDLSDEIYSSVEFELGNPDMTVVKVEKDFGDYINDASGYYLTESLHGVEDECVYGYINTHKTEEVEGLSDAEVLDKIHSLARFLETL